MISALNTTITKKTVQITTKPPTSQLLFCSESISKYKPAKERVFRNS
jgi:hypothetical protein